MIDELLFQRGHIDVRIGDECDDYDVVLGDYYFHHVLGLAGEVCDSNGSEIEDYDLGPNDTFEIRFRIDERLFQKDDGEIVGFDELTIKVKGQIVTENYHGDYDVLRIDKYSVIDIKNWREGIEE